MEIDATTITTGILTFPRVEELDFVGPLEVFGMVAKSNPGAARVVTVAAETTLLRGDNGLHFQPDYSFETCPRLDVLVVPGGPGRVAAMDDPAITGWVRKQAETCRYVTSVCTGAFILAKAGLLEGLEATTHHRAFDEFCALPGVTLRKERIVHHGKIITCGGVSSGVDMALYLAGLLWGPAVAGAAARRIEWPGRLTEKEPVNG